MQGYIQKGRGEDFFLHSCSQIEHSCLPGPVYLDRRGGGGGGGISQCVPLLHTSREDIQKFINL